MLDTLIGFTGLGIRVVQDPARMRGPRWMLDVAGHYNRPDLFSLRVDRSPTVQVSFDGE